MNTKTFSELYASPAFTLEGAKARFLNQTKEKDNQMNTKELTERLLTVEWHITKQDAYFNATINELSNKIMACVQNAGVEGLRKQIQACIYSLQETIPQRIQALEHSVELYANQLDGVRGQQDEMWGALESHDKALKPNYLAQAVAAYDLPKAVFDGLTYHEGYKTALHQARGMLWDAVILRDDPVNIGLGEAIAIIDELIKENNNGQ